MPRGDLSRSEVTIQLLLRGPSAGGAADKARRGQIVKTMARRQLSLGLQLAHIAILSEPVELTASGPARASMSKNIILLSDGTGNSSAKIFKTNVWRLFQILDLHDPTKQVAFYDDGVGTSSFKAFAILGGVFGFGLKAQRDRYLQFLLPELPAWRSHLLFRLQSRRLHDPYRGRDDRASRACELQ
jgi:hypothetical protein